MKIKHILGTVTIFLIVGGTIYAIKKSKDRENGEEISLAEAKKIVADKQAIDEVFDRQDARLVENYTKADDEATLALMRDIEDAQKDHRLSKIRGIRPNGVVVDEEDEENYEDIDETIEGPTIDPGDNIIYQKPTEDEELRYDPNSRDARNQYIRMELAEWVPLEDTYQTLLKLFDFPFKPQNDGDELLLTQIIDFRVQFFGYTSRWTKEVTIADIILHYARAAEFNCGESVRYWTEYFLGLNDMDYTTPSHIIDEVLRSLNSHTYFNEERQTFGLFGLTRESMDQAIRIANRNIDRSVTYEIEFNEFLKSCL